MKAPIILLVSLCLVIILPSCKKDKIHLLEESKSQNSTGNVNPLQFQVDTIIYTLDKVTLTTNSQNIEALLLVGEDADDIKIKNYLFKISMASRELVKDPGFVQAILDLATETNSDWANLMELKTSSGTYFDQINENLLSLYNITLEDIAADFHRKPFLPNDTIPETANTEYYVPCIFIPNMDRINPNYQVLVSPNVEVDPTSNPSIEDNVITWYYDEQGNLHEFLLSEETSLETTNPIFLFDNGDPNAKGMIQPPNEGSPVLQSEKKYFISNAGFTTMGYKYEPGFWGKCEFSVLGLLIAPDGSVKTTMRVNNTPFSWREIDEYVNPGSNQEWMHFADDYNPRSNPWIQTQIQYGVNMVYWNTFERDWNRTKKNLIIFNCNGVFGSFGERMHYNDNWYQWIPSTTNQHYVKFDWIDAQGTFHTNNWKGYFSMTKH